MKKVLAFMLALVLILSLAACGEEKEQKTVNSILQGEWSAQSSFDSSIEYTFQFNNGQYTFVEHWVDDGVNVVDESGTYTINAKWNEIECVCTKRKYVDDAAGNKRLLHYKLDSAENLSISYVDTDLTKQNN